MDQSSDQPLCQASRLVDSGVLIATIRVNQLRDAGTSYALRDELVSLADSSGALHLVIDARNLDFVGSIGLLAFLGVRRHLPQGRIVFCNLMPVFLEILQASKLVPTGANSAAPFEVASTLEEALAHVARG